MQIEWMEGLASKCTGTLQRSTAAQAGAPGGWLLRENAAKRATEEAGRKDLSASSSETFRFRPLVAVVIIPTSSPDQVIVPTDLHLNPSKRTVMARL